MGPPGTLPKSRPPRRNRQNHIAEASIEKAIRAVHLHLANSDVVMSPSKVSRMVRKFAAHVTQDGCTTFHEFLVNARDLSAAQRRRVVADPELTWFLSWREDPTGREACINVIWIEPEALRLTKIAEKSEREILTRIANGWWSR